MRRYIAIIMMLFSFILVLPAFAADDIQAKRKAYIQEMIQWKVFTKVESHKELVEVYVDKKFYSLTIDEKKSVLNVVYAYYYTKDPKDGKYLSIYLYDGYTGKKIGKYNKLGLDLD